MTKMHRYQLEGIIAKSLNEAKDASDWATDICIGKDVRVEAAIVAKGATLVAGEEIAQAIFHEVDPELSLTPGLADGRHAKPGDKIMSIKGRSRSILKAESLALGYLSKLSGIAYHTHRHVAALDRAKAQLITTRSRKLEGRFFEQWATILGGARTRRLCMSAGVLVTQNHCRCAGGLTAALNRLEESLPPTLKIEVAVRTLEELHEAIDAGADLVLLEGMSLAAIKMAARTAQTKVLLEASGEYSLETVCELAYTGVDFVSSDLLIREAPWAKITLEL